MTEWKELRCSNVDFDLIYKFHTSNTGYSLFVTDLSCIYHEQLTRTEINERASITGCRIDPGQDEGQHEILVNKIRAALEAEPETKAIILHKNTDDLRLHLVAPLPPPLEPLEWVINLTKLAPEHLQSHLIEPLVLTASFRKRQIQDLIGQLHAKDHVISKLLDKLEASGTDLTAIFPGAAGLKLPKKDGNREAVANHVRGVRRFDQEVWTERSRFVLSKSSASPQDIVQELVTAELLPSRRFPETASTLQQWRQTAYDSQADERHAFLGTTRSRNQQRQNFNSSRVTSYARDTHEPDRLNTSPSPRPASNLPANIENQGSKEDVTIDDETTEDEDDETHVQVKDSQTVKTPLPVQETATALEPAIPKKNLGFIGGRSNVAPSPVSTEALPNSNTSPKRPMPLGVIGGRAASKSNVTLPASESVGEPRDVVNETQDREKVIARQAPQTFETEEQKASRRRDELKRSLEAKPKAPPKKRKF
ncbi:MAG: hypothetical protein M1821_006771 [Bathelium mastoideum]|nr:MAG: hypothetical protein M1821_006771 [Bathelium mastoideum]